MTDPAVVVGIPTSNNESSIRVTLDALREQSRPPDRVVCCDKSDDRTPDIIRDFANSTQLPIELIEQSGDGVAEAYDQILGNIAGEYDLFVAFQTELVVESDWLSGHIEVHQAHPTIDIVNGDNKRRSAIDREVRPDERTFYVGRNFSAKVGTLEAIDGWDPNFLRGEDWDMRIRLAGSGARSYARTAIGYEPYESLGSDPYITVSKAKRRPTSVTFLSKYGLWYAWFHPSHVVADVLSLGAVILPLLAIVTLPFWPSVTLEIGVAAIGVISTYVVGHLLLRGAVDGDYVVGPVRKQLLNGLSVLYAVGRVFRRSEPWNMAGFNPDAIPPYRF